MSKIEKIVSIIVGIVALTGVYKYVPRITSSVRHAGSDMIIRGYVSGFGIIMVLVIIILSIYILQNIVGLVFAFLYGDASAEDSRPVQILGKINEILSVIYRIMGISAFGAMGAVGLFAPNLEGRNSTTNIICIIVIIVTLVAVIFSIRSIVRIIRR